MHRIARTTIATAALWAALAGCGGGDPGGTAPPPPVQVPPPVTMTHHDVRVGEPTRLSIPEIGVGERLHGVGLTPDGAMETPDFGDAGWYDVGPRPGAPGPAVVVAHVHGPAGDDVFARLHELDAGDRVTVERTDGSSTFVVTSVEHPARTHCRTGGSGAMSTAPSCG